MMPLVNNRVLLVVLLMSSIDNDKIHHHHHHHYYYYYYLLSPSLTLAISFLDLLRDVSVPQVANDLLVLEVVATNTPVEPQLL